jgi:hypothetical protein
MRRPRQVDWTPGRRNVGHARDDFEQQRICASSAADHVVSGDAFACGIALIYSVSEQASHRW